MSRRRERPVAPGSASPRTSALTRVLARVLTVVLAVIPCAACVTTGDVPGEISLGDPEAAADFALVEERLLALDTIYLDFEITSEGAVHSDLAGTLVLERGQTARLVAGGLFDKRRVALKFESDGQGFRGGSAAGQFDLPTPQALREGLVLGLVRMGLLHNLARVAGGHPPDATDGSVRLWVKPVDIQRGDDEREGERLLRSFTFGLQVSGRPAGEATLWVDAETLLPVRRVQTVKFAEGGMRVVESYPLFDAGGA